MKYEELMRYKRIHGLEEVVSDQEKQLFDKGVPIQKIVGFINFDNLKINVNKNVLIPRYETQEVVNKALEFIKPNDKVLDLCAGSGYIGLTIKSKVKCDVTLSDISDEAIEQINENAKINNLEVKVIKSDMFSQLKEKYNVIISNPPYIPSSTKLSDSVVKFEPSDALWGGSDGNDFYRIIFENVHDFLTDNGVLILELSEDNVQYLSQKNVKIMRDINGKNRIGIWINTK